MSKEVLETVRNNSLHPTRSMNIERSLHAQMEVYKGALSDLASSDEFLRKCNVLGAELSLSGKFGVNVDAIIRKQMFQLVTIKLSF